MLSQSYLSRFISMRMNPEIDIDAAVLDQYPAKEYHRVARELIDGFRFSGPIFGNCICMTTRVKRMNISPWGKGALTSSRCLDSLGRPSRNPRVLPLNLIRKTISGPASSTLKETGPGKRETGCFPLKFKVCCYIFLIGLTVCRKKSSKSTAQ